MSPESLFPVRMRAGGAPLQADGVVAAVVKINHMDRVGRIFAFFSLPKLTKKIDCSVPPQL